MLGVDLGSRRIGVAVSDGNGRVATPVTTIWRSGDPRCDHNTLAGLVADYGAGSVIVGLPLSMSGAAGPAAQSVLAEIEEMRAVIGVPVHTHDERLTTVAAAGALKAAGRRGRRQRQVVDQAAATLILQSWLDKQGTP
jgi:putative Holliday junction resolvase